MKERILALRREGVSKLEICERLGCSLEMVQAVVGKQRAGQEIARCRCGTHGYRRIASRTPYICSFCRNQSSTRRTKEKESLGATKKQLREAGLKVEPAPRKCGGCKGRGYVQGARGRTVCEACQGWTHARRPKQAHAHR